MNEVEVYELLKDKGYTEAQVAGIMGNIAVETGGTFDYRTEQRGGNGYGLFQFDFMKPYYFDYLKEKEIEDSPAAQVEFMHDTIYGDKQDIIGAKNARIIRERLNTEYPEDVASVFMEEWEKPSVPHEGRRQGEAVKYFNFPPVKEEVVDLEATGFERSIK